MSDPRDLITQEDVDQVWAELSAQHQKDIDDAYAAYDKAVANLEQPLQERMP